MSCRIGITTDLKTRKEYWQKRVSGFSDWQILEEHDTMEAAQKAETRLAKEYGCTSHPGGEEGSPPWYVYGFNYTSDPGS